MYKPFSKEYAIKLATELQSYVGAEYKDGDKVFRIDVISNVPLTPSSIHTLNEMYFKAANRLDEYKKIPEFNAQYKGHEFDVVYFAKAPSSTPGFFTTTVVPVSLIGVGENEIKYGFSFLDPK